MNIIQNISAGPGYLHVEATGTFSLREAKKNFVEMMEAVARHKSGKVLFDARRVEGSPQFLERFEYGKFAAETVATFEPRGVCFAYVLEKPLRDPERLGETVARNRGMNITVFEQLDDALAWLGVASIITPQAGAASQTD